MSGMSALRYLDLSGNNFNTYMSSMYLEVIPWLSFDIVDTRSDILPERIDYGSPQVFHNSTLILDGNDATCCIIHIESGDCTATITPSQFLTWGRILPNLIRRIVMCVCCY